jgi:DNA-binding GntR family transcriptional regulator
MKPGRSSASDAYERLLSEIEEGGLPPGTRLREAELADRLAISRTPVREALKRLELQGLVTHEPHHGAVIASLEYGQVTELYLLREILEGSAARLAAQYATETEIGILQRMVERDRTLVDQPRQLSQANRLFHQQIRDTARNRYVNAALENLRLSLALLAGTTLGAPGRGSASVEEHAAIVACIAARDRDGAETSARCHILNAFRTRIEIQQARPTA